MPSAGSSALVTGTSRGIGTAIARRLLDDGMAVVGASRGPSPLSHPNYSHLRVDLADPEQCDDLVRAALEITGTLDVLVNNAASIAYGRCWEVDDDTLDALLAVNLTAPFILSRAAARHWTARGRPGVIVNICSIESDVAIGTPPQAAYAVTKGGLVGLTRSLATDLAAQQIRVNGVAPGVIATELTPSSDGVGPPMAPLGRMGNPAEIAAAVAFVASDDATYMTGEIVYVDGGYRLP